ncbi:calcium:proton antiporter [Silvimonas amylolytica]|uniref:Ionic transporter y4hA n=1 Tax=Silvimonas amylolytica TaxID=449663 RepID=A0ABQ2PFV9_9NEIS|nr:ionic transporter y4hA [Silvimonas amylolytica]GGP24448.1 ionic transporter y4hA [Silvimonas amylolytica]
MSAHHTSTPHWTWVLPILAMMTLGVALGVGSNGWLVAFATICLAGTVFAAVHHAEVIAHKVGEPFGTLVLAVAVTVIEVALIVSVMLTGGDAKAGLARDTVFAAVMIVCNGIVGLCLVLGALRHREQVFQRQGASAALAVLTALAVLALVLPNYATTVPGPAWSQSQLAFSGVASLVLYGTFVFVQTVRHRNYFLADPEPGQPGNSHDIQVPPPSGRLTLISCVLLLVSLVGVVGLAKILSPTVETFVVSMGAPAMVVGVIIAGLVLLPEGIAAAKAARANQLQQSLNLALGSALASIGLTIPTVAVLFIVLDRPLILGLDAKESVMLALTLLLSAITLGTGRTNILQGVVHLVVFAAFVFLNIVP